MVRIVTAAVAATAALIATPAIAQSSYSTFENVPGGPSNPGYTTVASADDWTGGPNGIELQNHVAGTPQSPDGGDVFVELDTNANSYMYRTLDAGLYSLSFLYSPRPGNSSESNVIDVLLDGASLFSITGTGGADTSWMTYTIKPFAASAGSTLTFAADGTSDSLGGYVDNIRISAVPEPATWGMMILGLGIVGYAMRRRRHGLALAA